MRTQALRIWNRFCGIDPRPDSEVLADIANSGEEIPFMVLRSLLEKRKQNISRTEEFRKEPGHFKISLGTCGGMVIYAMKSGYFIEIQGGGDFSLTRTDRYVSMRHVQSSYEEMQRVHNWRLFRKNKMTRCVNALYETALDTIIEQKQKEQSEIHAEGLSRLHKALSK